MCNCIAKINDLLKEQGNTELDIPVTFSIKNFSERGLSADRVRIATRKRDTHKREQAKALIPAYCPFCGEEYPEKPTAEKPPTT